MPFTVSHAAAALPIHSLARRRLPLAALMIGSMSPDLAYFLPGQPLSRMETHNIPGLFWFCWPVSFALWLVFVHVLEKPTIVLLPPRWRTRIAPSNRALTGRLFALVSIAILVGAVTHLIWDDFTHSSSPLVHAVPALRGRVVEIAGRSLRFYAMLQHLSSLLGGLALLAWTIKLLRPPTHPDVRAVPYPDLEVSNAARGLAIACVGGATLAAAFAAYFAHWDDSFQARLFYFAIAGMAAAALAWLAVALFVSWRVRPARSLAPGQT